MSNPKIDVTIEHLSGLPGFKKFHCVTLNALIECVNFLHEGIKIHNNNKE